MGYPESWAAYTYEDEVAPSLDVSMFLREIGIRSSSHYFERGPISITKFSTSASGWAIYTSFAVYLSLAMSMR
jgi:hypothetical protein